LTDTVTDKPTRLQKYSAPALEKGLDILELLSVQRGRALSHADIAAGIGRSKNEIFRMMVVLEERGYIERGEGDLFQLSAKTDNLASSVSSETQLRTIAQPILSRLSEETGLTNHLWMLMDGAMRVALSNGSAGSYSLKLNEGEKSPLFLSSAGACFLSALGTSAERLNLLRDFGEFVPEAQFAPFEADIDACAQSGVCAKPSPQMPTITEISTPVRVGVAEDVIGAVTIPTISAMQQDNEIARVTSKLLEAVGALNMRLSLLAPAGLRP
jgi:DNA-binding IclR family transcriptional regulator